jgi:phosphoribosylformylglycinamidine synthase subunit PurL
MGDAGVVRLPGSPAGWPCATDGNGRWCELDPREGARRVVAEAFRNVACVGARPLATTNCLNFGNPERPEIMWQLAEAIAGLGEACAELDIPVTGGNVSLYNETRGVAIHPTPVVGILGVLDDATDALDDRVRGRERPGPPRRCPDRGRPGRQRAAALPRRPPGGVLAPVDLELEAAIAEVLHVAVHEGWLALGPRRRLRGLLVTLAESAVAGDIGVEVTLGSDLSPAQVLCSEAPGRVVVTVPTRGTSGRSRSCAPTRGSCSRTSGPSAGSGWSIGDLVDLPLATSEAALGGLAASSTPERRSPADGEVAAPGTRPRRWPTGPPVRRRGPRRWYGSGHLRRAVRARTGRVPR